MAVKPDCEECRALYAIYDDEPDCESCIPEIMADNKVAWQVFNEVNDQHIMAFGGPIALNLIPVFKVMDRMGIENQMSCIRKVKTAYISFISAIKAKEK